MEQHRHPILIGRRSFLKIGGIGLGFLLGGSTLFKAAARADSGGPRRLVLLEMNGGNDGLNTLVPYGESAYYDLRKRLAIQPSEVLHIDSRFGFHPSLRLLKQRYDGGQVAIFHGLGHPSPDLSHFAMMDYWRAGNLQGSAQTNSTGWAGRLVDVVGDSSAPIAGLSLDSSIGPQLLDELSRTAAADSPDAGALNIPPGFDQTLLNALRGMSDADDRDNPPMREARRGIAGGFALSEFLNMLSRMGSSYPDTATGQLMALAAQILVVNDWVRVIHIPLPYSFDHHSDQPGQHPAILSEMDGAIEAFLVDIETRGLADKTVVMTTSEFGRRADDNGDNGTDHGTANVQFVFGRPVRGAKYGEYPSLANLDVDGNLVATAPFLDLLATVTEGWMGAPASEVVPGGRVINMFV